MHKELQSLDSNPSFVIDSHVHTRLGDGRDDGLQTAYGEVSEKRVDNDNVQEIKHSYIMSNRDG